METTYKADFTNPSPSASPTPGPSGGRAEIPSPAFRNKIVPATEPAIPDWTKKNPLPPRPKHYYKPPPNKGKSPRGRSPRGRSPRGRSPRGRSPRGRSPRGRSPRSQHSSARPRSR